MDCFQDFCLACDRECNGTVYCSQACRLAELERATTSAPTSPLSSSTTSHSLATLRPLSTTSNIAAHQSTGFDFSERATSRSPTQQDESQSSYFMRSPAQQSFSQTAPSQRPLTPSSSRTSLSSTTSESSTSSSGGISHQARLELAEYFHSFDLAKSTKRRPSLR